MTRDRGFALLAMLWFVAGLAAVSGTGLLAARSGMLAAANRIDMVRGRWAAEACVALVLSALDSAAASGAGLVLDDTILAWRGSTGECRSSVTDPGARLHPDSAGDAAVQRLAALSRASGVPLESLLTRASNGRVNLNTAGREVLAALPGVSVELAERVLQRRALGIRIAGVGDLAALGGGSSREALAANAAELERLTSVNPASLTITSIGWASRNYPVVRIDLVVVSAGSRAAVARRQLW